MEADEGVQGKKVDAEATCGKWFMLPFAIISFGIGMGLPVSLSIMFLDWQETFQVSRAHTAGIHSTCAGFLLGGAVIPGYLMNKFGARPTILAGSLMATTGFLLSMFATSVEYLIVTVGVIGGLGGCFIHITSIPCITAVFDKYLSVVISSCTISSAACSVLFPYIYRYLVNEYSWRGVFGILAGISLNVCVSGMIITSVTYRKSQPSLVLTVEDPVATPTNESDKICLDKKNANVLETEDQNGNEELSAFVSESNSCDQSFTSKCIEQNDFVIQGSGKKRYSADRRRFKNIVQRIGHSDWKFLVDIVFLSFILHCIFCVSCMFSFPLLITEFSKNRGFSKDSGTLFFSLIFLMSIFGRIIAGLLILLYTYFSSGNAISMLILSFLNDYTLTMVCLSVYGMCMGAVIALQMKCVLDIQSVNAKSYPLALGVAITSEGIADFVVPVLIGYSVDATGSYTLILIVMGIVSLISSIFLAVGFRFWNKQEKKRES